MKNLLFLLFAAIIHPACNGQQETVGLVKFTLPGKWKKEVKNSATIYTKIDNKKNTWCQIAVYSETASRGSIEQDFESEWQNIVLPLGVSEAPQATEVVESDGWKVKAGAGTFNFNGSNAMTSLTVASGYNVCLSVLANTNSSDYSQVIEDFFTSVQLSVPSNSNNPSTTTNSANNNVQPTPAVKGNFAFSTTNFDDGWVSTVQEEWVEVTKGNLRVLLHFDKEGSFISGDPQPVTNAAWNILVAPRYSNLQNYKTTYISSYVRGYLGWGYATENSTQKKVFVVLFRQNGGWIEVISPNKEAFIQYFKFDPDVMGWDSELESVKIIDNMNSRNRFAVAASDLDGTGKWDNNFASNSYWANAYTGMYAGMSTYTSSQTFSFGKNQTFSWELVAANSRNGSTSFAGAKGGGKFQMVNNWQIRFDKIEGKVRTYDAYFSATRYGRLLYMNDADYKGSGMFTAFARKE